MDFRLLEYFLRVAEIGSINRAAAELHLSQPALSRHVATLEHEMATPLFTRTQGGVRLTDAGKLLADRARPLLRQFTVLKEQVGEQAAGQLSIGTPPAWQHVFTSRFAEQLTAQHPGVALRIHEGVSNILRDYMLGGLLDLSIVPFEQHLAPGYRQTPVVREPMVLVSRAGAGLRADTPALLTSLDGVRLVLPAKPNVLRVHVEGGLQRKGLRFKLAVETDTLALCLDLARRGVGNSVVPACSLYAEEARAGLCWAPLKGQYVTWALCEYSARDHSLPLREGRKVALATLAEVVKLPGWLGAEGLKALSH